MATDPNGRYMSLDKRWHLIGLELGISVASIGLRNEPTGFGRYFNADVAATATAKRDLQAGELLDGEGGYTVYGKLVPARRSSQRRILPLGLAHKLKLVRPVPKDRALTWDDVEADETVSAYEIRREMETTFAGELARRSASSASGRWSVRSPITC